MDQMEMKGLSLSMSTRDALFFGFVEVLWTFKDLSGCYSAFPVCNINSLELF